MKERPILFSGPMVRAILDGRKTQTRRIVKPDAHLLRYTAAKWPDTTPAQLNEAAGMAAEIFVGWWYGGDSTREMLDGKPPTPFGAPGNRLWVRENARLSTVYGSGGVNTSLVLQYQASAGSSQWSWTIERSDAVPYHFDRWTPSVHMPRWASRLTLEITGVRVERLQDITEADATAEGVTAWRESWTEKQAAEAWLATCCHGHPEETGTAKRLFAVLWDEINGKRPGCAWADNPWVWVISFRRVEP